MLAPLKNCLLLLFSLMLVGCPKHKKTIEIDDVQYTIDTTNEVANEQDVSFEREKRFEFIKNNKEWQLEIYIFQDDEMKLLSTISYDDFDYRLIPIISKNFLLCSNCDNTELLYYDFNKGKLDNTGIPCGKSFAISDDEKYVCVSVSNNKLKLFEGVETLLPCIYDFQTKREVKVFYFDFLEKEIGIDLYISYDNKNNQMDIEYCWDSPIPKFTGFISLDNFEFTRLK